MIARAKLVAGANGTNARERPGAELAAGYISATFFVVSPTRASSTTRAISSRFSFQQETLRPSFPHWLYPARLSRAGSVEQFL